ncbi:MAG: GspH/FimT family pseudopilin [Desulfuromonadales bacterium]|nr:GspH/FimT family pseudopilin [Desulfuromonadales bacterium]
MATHRIFLQTNKGFTLVEMMVVIGMISILAAISYPSVSGMMRKYQFRAAASEVLNTAMQARSNAVRDNESWRLQIAVDGTNYKLDLIDPSLNIISSFIPGNGIQLLPPGDNIKCGNATKNWNSSLIIQTGGAGPPDKRLLFTGRGFSDAGSIFLEDAKNDMCFAISVSSSGVVKLRRYNGATPYADSNWLD